MRTPRFLRCINYLFDLEGGFADAQGDPGGRTIYGITERDHPEAWVSGPPTKDAAAAIYWAWYWAPNRGDDLDSERIAKEVFEASVLCGVRKGAGFLQAAVNIIAAGILEPLKVDGVIGAKTIAAVNTLSRRYENAVYRAQNYLQADYLIKCDMDKFNLGWFNRRLD